MDKNIVVQFTQYLNNEMLNSIDQNIDFNVFKDYRSLLLFQSAPIHVIKDLLTEIYSVNNDIKVIIIGDDTMNTINVTFPENSIVVIPHNKRFDDVDFQILPQLLNEYKIDVVMYCNNYVSCVDFSNVEHILMFFEDKIPILSYSYIQKELNLHRKIAYHLYGCILYKDLLEWFNTFE